jgi:hypothetical protein
MLGGMQVRPPGAFSRGKLILAGQFPHITPDSLLQELSQQWGPQGFTVYRSSLPAIDVALKKSGWTGIAIKIKHTGTETTIVYNAFSPSTMVRMLALGLIPILILNANSWKPLLRSFEQYAQASPFFGGQMSLQPGMQGMPPQQQMQGMPPQQAAPPQYPCQQCQTPLQWVAEHQRWFCPGCQQYK